MNNKKGMNGSTKLTIRPERSRGTGKPVIFLDFDNTITNRDTLDDMLVRFSKDDKWMELEKMWKNGEIGSRQCLRGQVDGIRITKFALDRYLTKIKIDPYFKKLISLFSAASIKSIIVSDNFDYILNRVLENNDIRGLKVYSNSVRILGDRLIPSFPYTNGECGDCAHCKKTSLEANLSRGEKAVYIGDGKSDVCASESADMVFAKDYLKKHFKDKGLSHIPIKNLKDVYDYFERRLA